MSAPTPAQQAIIDYGKGNVLVSAAAGSGKTTVMVARILRIITEEHVPLNRLLVVTFTNAAAAHMREKIYEGLQKKAEEAPEDPFLQEQLLAVSSCNVQTIHSFCLSVVKDYQSLIPELEPGFRICDPTEAVLLKKEALDKALESLYRDAETDPEGNQGFLLFSRNFGGKRGDRGIEELILKAHDAAFTTEEPEEWLERSVSRYDPSRAARYADEVKAVLREKVLEGIFDLETALSLYPGLVPKATKAGFSTLNETPLTDKIDFLRGLLADWASLPPENIMDTLEALDWGRFSLRVEPGDVYEGLKAARNRAKNSLTSETDFDSLRRFLTPDAELAAKNYEMMKGLRAAVLRLESIYREAKNKRALVDFSDFEHFALRILLSRDEAGRSIPSEAARALQQSFDYIFIDEYQDSNRIQELILSAVSRRNEKDAPSNLFMVGDVKQSIYGFRHAAPDLFKEKESSYPDRDEPDSPGRKFLLANNFRSEAPILDSANFFFSCLMNGSGENIDYATQRLVVPEGKPAGPSVVELDLLVQADSETQARHVALKIRALLERGLSVNNKSRDPKAPPTRPMEAGDVVLLLHDSKKFDIYRKALEDAGLRTVCESKTDYFRSEEILEVRRILTVIDNPRQDVPLVSVLHSAVFGFTAEELGRVRLQSMQSGFYDAVELCAEEDQGELGGKCRAFLETLRSWREAALHLGVHDLLWKVYLETKIYFAAAEDPNGGQQRRANLDRLLDIAIRFENSSLSGLYQFLKYLEQLEKFNEESGEISVSGGEENAVRIMTIHKSKGLEFPCVFLPELEKPFNTKDERQPLLFDRNSGIGTKNFAKKKAQQHDTLERYLMLRAMHRRSLAEEMRVLYVAMTRAENHLFLSGSLSSSKAYYGTPEALYFDASYGGGALPDEILYREKDYLSWLLRALSLQTSKNVPHPFLTVESVDSAAEAEEWASLSPALESALSCAAGSPEPENVDPGASFGWSYPFAAEGALKARYSVSEIKKDAYSEEEREEEARTETLIPLGDLTDEVRAETPESKEAAAERKARGARKGTVMHAFLAVADWSRIRNESDFDAELERLRGMELFSDDDSELLRKYRHELLMFASSELCARMLRSPKVWKEQPFILSLTAAEMKELAPEWFPLGKGAECSPDARLMVQGIIDLFFEEDGELVLADYKTDRNLDDNALSMYGLQLKLYQLALERILHRSVREKLLYATRTGKEIYI